MFGNKVLFRLLSLSSCSTSQVMTYEDNAFEAADTYKKELKANGQPTKGTGADTATYIPEIEYKSTVEYASNLSKEYRRAAAAASLGQDVGAVAIILSAGTAAGGLIFNSSLNLVKGAGLAAGLVDANLSYFKPGDAQMNLLIAAGQASCIASAAYPTPDKPEEGRQVLISALGIIQQALMVSLAKKTPSYDALVTALLGALEKQLTPEGRKKDSRSIEDLQHAVAACVERS